MSFNNLENESKSIPESTGFTQINNNVINNIKNGDAFLVWAYLFSKTSNWKVIKENIKNVYGFGDVKLRKIFSYLHRSGLIEYIQPKNKDGTFQKTAIRPLNGSKFDKNEPFCTPSPVGQETVPPVNRTNGNEALRNTNNTKEIKELNKTPISPLGECVRFNDFWSRYPIKKSEDACFKKWKFQNLDSIADEIISKLDMQILNDRAWLGGFIPNPLTYINQKKWKDEIDMRPRGVSPKQQSADNFHTTMAKYKKEPTDGYYDEHGNFTANYL